MDSWGKEVYFAREIKFLENQETPIADNFKVFSWFQVDPTENLRDVDIEIPLKLSEVEIADVQDSECDNVKEDVKDDAVNLPRRDLGRPRIIRVEGVPPSKINQWKRGVGLSDGNYDERSAAKSACGSMDPRDELGA